SLIEKAQKNGVVLGLCPAAMMLLSHSGCPFGPSAWLALKLCPISCAGTVTRNGAICSKSEIPYEPLALLHTTDSQAMPATPWGFSVKVLPVHRCDTSCGAGGGFWFQLLVKALRIDSTPRPLAP